MEDEKRLIHKIQKRGDRDAADQLIRKYYDEINRYIAKQMADKEDAMDITQEVFVSALRTISRYDEQKAGFRTWLYRIATNKTVDFFRNRAASTRHSLDISELDLPDERDFFLQIEQNDLTSQLRACISTLPADSQRIFRLKFFGDCTFAQIAEQTAMPEATVKTRYYRLLSAMRKEFHNDRT